MNKLVFKCDNCLVTMGDFFQAKAEDNSNLCLPCYNAYTLGREHMSRFVIMELNSTTRDLNKLIDTLRYELPRQYIHTDKGK